MLRIRYRLIVSLTFLVITSNAIPPCITLSNHNHIAVSACVSVIGVRVPDPSWTVTVLCTWFMHAHAIASAHSKMIS